jgi:hypothetical protein
MVGVLYHHPERRWFTTQWLKDKGYVMSEQDLQSYNKKNEVFFGDTGELDVNARKALVLLCVGPSIDAIRSPEVWKDVISHESELRKRLNEMFLELIVDHEQEVAFAKQNYEAECNPPILMRKKPQPFMDSVLLLFLRKKLLEATAQGNRAVVDEMEMSDHLKAFQSNTGDDAGYNRKCKAAIERIRKLQLLNQIKEGEPRFEISPTLKLIFPAEEIVRLEKRYQELATQGAIDSVDVDSESNDEEAV